MVKNILLISLLCTLSLSCQTKGEVKVNHPFARFSIPNSEQGCSYPASPVNFCDDRHMGLINDAINKNIPNFDKKYILLFIQERIEYFERSLVIIDTDTGVVYPAPIDFYSGAPDESGKINNFGDLNFHVGDNDICINGAIYAYRVQQNGKFCFKFDEGRFTGLNTAYTDTSP